MSIKSRLSSLAALVGVLSVIPLAASAAGFSVDLPDDVLRGDPGTVFDLGTYDVPGTFVGQVCTVEAIGNNNSSVHPGNDIVVSSVNSVTLADVEAEAGKDTVADGPLTLGDTVQFSLVMGSDGIYSAGFVVQFDCAPVETTSTTVPPPSTTMPPTTQPSTTTTIGSTTTTLASSTTTTKPVVSPTTTPDTLPFTGADTVGVGLVAVLALGAGVSLVLVSRKSKESTGS